MFSRESSRHLRYRRLRDELDLSDDLITDDKDSIQHEFLRTESEHLRQTRAMMAKSTQALNSPDDTPTPCESDFEVIRVLGKGSFGVVRLVREKSDSSSRDLGQDKKEVFAMKVIRKSDMLRSSQEGHLRAERDFLVASEGSKWYVCSLSPIEAGPCLQSERQMLICEAGRHDRIIPLVASFQDSAHLYLVMEYMPGGDFLSLLIRESILHEAVARFYIAEMIACVEEAHALRCIHRDIKPDNFLVTASGHLKISDFGLSFDGHWSHDSNYYTSTRYSLLQKLGIRVEGDAQDRKEARNPQTSMKWSNAITASLRKHDPSEGCDGFQKEPLLDWRDRYGIRTSAASVVGTSQYMAPEVVRGDKYDGRCD